MKYLFLSILLVFSISSFAQRSCGTMPRQALRVSQSAINMNVYSSLKKEINTDANANDTLLIPVVVHVIYKTNAQQISTAQINSQIRILNEDFQRKPGTNGFNTHPVGANTMIKFQLAKVDPLGNPTNGITYTSTTKNSFDDDALKTVAGGGVAPWPTDKYFNIWVCRLSGGVLGYASFPGEDPAVDGVVCDYQSFGDVGAADAPYDLGRTATHEVGHWLGLFHIWGDDEDQQNMCLGSDYIDDTPNQSDYTADCPTNARISCNNGPGGDMFMNYMDYTEDACLNMFTHLQSVKMRSVLQGERSSLLTSPGLGINTRVSNRLNVYPNPSRGSFTLPLPSYEVGNLTMTDALGRSVDISIPEDGIVHIETPGLWIGKLKNIYGEEYLFRVMIL